MISLSCSKFMHNSQERNLKGFFTQWMQLRYLQKSLRSVSQIYHEIGDAKFKFALWTFKQQLALNIWAYCRISIVLLQTSLCCALLDTAEPGTSKWKRNIGTCEQKLYPIWKHIQPKKHVEILFSHYILICQSIMFDEQVKTSKKKSQFLSKI